MWSVTYLQTIQQKQMFIELEKASMRQIQVVQQGQDQGRPVRCLGSTADETSCSGATCACRPWERAPLATLPQAPWSWTLCRTWVVGKCVLITLVFPFLCVFKHDETMQMSTDD